ncbi:MAG: hypothetical protein O2782_08255 [bacterium]|nr:hypothetical protein [bacterium]
MPDTVPAALRRRACRPRHLLRRVFGAALVIRLQLRPPAPLDGGLILLAWLRRPVIEMPLEGMRLPGSRIESVTDRLRRRLDEVYPF